MVVCTGFVMQRENRHTPSTILVIFSLSKINDSFFVNETVDLTVSQNVMPRKKKKSIDKIWFIKFSVTNSNFLPSDLRYDNAKLVPRVFDFLIFIALPTVAKRINFLVFSLSVTRVRLRFYVTASFLSFFFGRNVSPLETWKNLDE